MGMKNMADMNKLKYIFERMPKLNEEIVTGISVVQTQKIEHYIDWIFKCSAKMYPAGITYIGGRRCTPKETFNEVTRSASNGTTSSRGFEMARSDVYLMRYEFAYNGVLLNPRFIFLPFIGPGGLMFLRDTQYSVTPVLTGKIFNIEKRNIYLPSTRLRMGFWQIDASCIVNNVIINQYAVGSYLYKISPETNRAKLKPLLIHYILAKYGLADTLKFYGLKGKVGYAELDELDKSDWMVFRSRQVQPRNKSLREFPPSELRIAISKKTYYTLSCNMIASIFYIIDNATAATADINELNDPNLWLRLLDFFIFKEQCGELKIRERMQNHLDSMESTIDAITIDTLEKADIDCSTIFELFRYLSLNFQDNCIHYDFGTMYDLQISTVEPLTFGIRKDIFNAMYGLQKTPLCNLNASKINRILSNALKRDRVLSVKGHGELEPTSIASTCTLYGPTADVITHSKATSLSGDTIKDLNDPGLLMHPSILEIGCIHACTGKEVTGRGILNPFQRFGRGHTTTASPEHKEKLDKLNLQLKRG